MRAFAVAALLCITGCGGIQLDPRPVQPVNLGGEWIVDFVASEHPEILNGPIKEERLDRRPRSPRDLRRLFRGSSLAFITQDFQVLNADKLEIEQGRDSLGIQYHPGVYRDVSWGERDRGLWEVYAGWQETDMLIVSTAPDMRVVERFNLVSPTTLKITVSISADGEDHEIVRVFDRGR